MSSVDDIQKFSRHVQDHANDYYDTFDNFLKLRCHQDSPGPTIMQLALTSLNVEKGAKVVVPKEGKR